MLAALVICGVLIIALVITGVKVQSGANERLFLSNDSGQLITLLAPWARRLGLEAPVALGELPLPIKSEAVTGGHFLLLSEGAQQGEQELSVSWCVPWPELSTPPKAVCLTQNPKWWANKATLDAPDPATRVRFASGELFELIERAELGQVKVKLAVRAGELSVTMEGKLPILVKLMEPLVVWLKSIPEDASQATWPRAMESWLKVSHEPVALNQLALLRADKRCDEAQLFEVWAKHSSAAIVAMLALEPKAEARLEREQLCAGIAQGLLREGKVWPSRPRWFTLINELDAYGEVLAVLGGQLSSASRVHEQDLIMKIDETILALLGEVEHGRVRLEQALANQLLALTIQQEDVSRVPILGVHIKATEIVNVMVRLWSLDLIDAERVSWGRVLVMHCRDEVAVEVLDTLYKSFMLGNQEVSELNQLSASIAHCDPPLAWLRKVRSVLGVSRERQLNQLSEEIWQRLALRVAGDGAVTDQEREAFFKGGALLMTRARATPELFKLWREQFIDDPRAPNVLLEALIGLCSLVSSMGWGSAQQAQLDALSGLIAQLEVDWAAHDAVINLWCQLMYFHPLMVPNILTLHGMWAAILPADKVAAQIEEVLAKGGVKMKPPAWFPLWRWAIERGELATLASLARSAHDETVEQLLTLEPAPSFESLWAAIRAAAPSMWALLCPFIVQAPYLQSERELYLLEALNRDDRAARDAALEALAQCGSLEVVMPLMELTRGVFVSGELKVYVQRTIAQIQRRHGVERADGALSLAADDDGRGGLSLTQSQGGLNIVEEEPH